MDDQENRKAGRSGLLLLVLLVAIAGLLILVQYQRAEVVLRKDLVGEAEEVASAATAEVESLRSEVARLRAQLGEATVALEQVRRDLAVARMLERSRPVGPSLQNGGSAIVFPEQGKEAPVYQITYPPGDYHLEWPPASVPRPPDTIDSPPGPSILE